MQPRTKILNCSEGFQTSTGEGLDDLAHALCMDDSGYVLSVSRFPDSDDLVEVMVYDQIVHKTGDVEVELRPDQFRLTLSKQAADKLGAIDEYVVPLAATPEQLAQLDEALTVIFDGAHGGRYVKFL